jgi:hypothetical protein
MRFDVFGRLVDVRRSDGGWQVSYPGADGKALKFDFSAMRQLLQARWNRGRDQGGRRERECACPPMTTLHFAG